MFGHKQLDCYKFKNWLEKKKKKGNPLALVYFGFLYLMVRHWCNYACYKLITGVQNQKKAK